MAKVFDLSKYRTYRAMENHFSYKYREVAKIQDRYRKEQAISELERLLACVNNIKKEYLLFSDE